MRAFLDKASEAIKMSLRWERHIKDIDRVLPFCVGDLDSDAFANPKLNNSSSWNHGHDKAADLLRTWEELICLIYGNKGFDWVYNCGNGWVALSFSTCVRDTFNHTEFDVSFSIKKNDVMSRPEKDRRFISFFELRVMTRKLDALIGGKSKIGYFRCAQIIDRRLRREEVANTTFVPSYDEHFSRLTQKVNSLMNLVLHGMGKV